MTVIPKIALLNFLTLGNKPIQYKIENFIQIRGISFGHQKPVFLSGLKSEKSNTHMQACAMEDTSTFISIKQSTEIPNNTEHMSSKFTVSICGLPY